MSNPNPHYHSGMQAMDAPEAIRLATLSEDSVQNNQPGVSQQSMTEASQHLEPPPMPTVPESELNIARVAAYEAKTELALSRVQCEKLQQRVDELSSFLQSAQETIFRLQPYQQSINKSDATAAYSSLCMSVKSWVDVHLGNAIEDRIIFKESAFDSRSALELLDLVSPAGKAAFSCQGTDEYNVIAAVMQFLKSEIFDKDFYCPFDSKSMEFLSSIEKSMRTLVPQRDAATIRSWRSETLNAVANRPDFDSLRADRIRQLTTSLAQKLRIFVPREYKREIHSSIQTAIIERAIELAHKLQLSVDEFKISWTSYSGGQDNHSGYQVSIGDQFECVNLLAGGRVIKFPVDERSTQRGHITYILDICPGLYWRNVKSEGYPDPEVLKKPEILVAMTKPEQSPFRWSSSNGSSSTLLGWINNQTQIRQRPTGPR